MKAPVKVSLRINDSFLDYNLYVNEEPHCERDLIKYDEYLQLCRRIGTGSHIKATVEIYKGMLRGTTTYTFKYTVIGNSIRSSTFSEIMDKYKNVCQMQSMNYDMESHLMRFIMVFDDQDYCHRLFKEFDGICNVGSFFGIDPNTDEPVGIVEFMNPDHLFPEDDVPGEKDADSQPNLTDNNDLWSIEQFSAAALAFEKHTLNVPYSRIVKELVRLSKHAVYDLSDVKPSTLVDEKEIVPEIVQISSKNTKRLKRKRRVA